MIYLIFLRKIWLVFVLRIDCRMEGNVEDGE